MESQNHLRDAVDKKCITEATRLEMDALAEEALREVTGLKEYLQSAEALQNARRARERRIASRHERRSKAIGLEKTPMRRRMPKIELRTQDHQTRNQELNLNLNTKLRSENREA